MQTLLAERQEAIELEIGLLQAKSRPTQYSAERLQLLTGAADLIQRARGALAAHPDGAEAAFYVMMALFTHDGVYALKARMQPLHSSKGAQQVNKERSATSREWKARCRTLAAELPDKMTAIAKARRIRKTLLQAQTDQHEPLPLPQLRTIREYISK